MALERVNRPWSMNEWYYHANALDREFASLRNKVPNIQDIASFRADYLVAEERISCLTQAQFESAAAVPADLKDRIGALQILANLVASQAREILGVDL